MDKKPIKRKPSQKAIMIWSLFALFAYVCIFRDPVTAGIVAGVFTITINYLFRLRTKEKIIGCDQDKIG